MKEQYLFELHKLRCSYDKNYREGISRIVLEIEHLLLPPGRIIFIVGESGIGKSTILETLGLMNNTIVPSPSTYFSFSYEDKEVDLKAMWQRGDKVLSDFRLQNYSFIFQSTNLMKNFTAFENIAFTRMLQGYSRFNSFRKAKDVLCALGLDHVDEQRMAQELSGGQQQRLSFARAILPNFTVLFGDEPTGNLDSENAARVMTILEEKLKERPGASAIIVSHDMNLAITFADIIIKIQKRYRPKQHNTDEDITYGYVDDSCVYTKQDNTWTNGEDRYESPDFMGFLHKK